MRAEPSPRAAHEPKPLVAFDPASVRSQNRAGTVAATAAFGLMRTATRMSVRGTEHLPPAGTGIIVAAYHANHLDPILVGLALKRHGRMPHFLAKSTLFTGALGVILKRIGQIPVLRASAQAGDSLAYAKQALANGQTVVIYPEGTLTKDPQLWPQHFKTGTARLALETGAPIVPVAHWGLDTVYPRGQKKVRFRPFSHDSVVAFGPAIDYSDLWDRRDEKKTMGDLSQRVKNTVAAMVAELSERELPQRFTAKESGE
ncbi:MULTISPECIES: lysophospholipid acyltransferase family protein [Brevibacterium]|uniref:1-acyl-sn-glycerol-3-phosphate acyltransferases n=2 Tax=Brevibacterium linens TaxID=1703 RepID=A0A2H1J3S8_BRELN|nr:MULTISPECIES: lysophospholipid acyltransferase family protein [Brevibacterium]KAB1949902.1 1-acyl-sn-glycerol-3-phosphate acyltransferase [Brevibacterium linens ATCC 9172]SMX66690.1 1-acyl-sn-glycerol-3-phosphate acyltransferases [Brevibacterium linens ATCC 9172]SMX82073.1 1-acyl-sn-glycerol-3-phosphate acyltransferases [Brevibacterium linens]